MVKTQKTFYQVWSSTIVVPHKRYARVIYAMQRACKLREEHPGAKFYVTQSIGRFDDQGYQPW
jgi:hypothetical protein